MKSTSHYCLPICLSFFSFLFFSHSDTLSQEYPVLWEEIVGVEHDVESNKLHKLAPSGWGTGGAISGNVLPAYEDGYVIMQVDGDFNSKAFGFSVGNSNEHHRDIDYGFLIDPFQILPSGKKEYRFSILEAQHQPAGSYPVIEGDKLRILRFKDNIFLFKGKKLYGSFTTDPAKNLIVDAALQENGSTLRLKTSFSFIPLEEQLEQDEGIFINTLSLTPGIPFTLLFIGQTEELLTGSRTHLPVEVQIPKYGLRGQIQFDSNAPNASSIPIIINFRIDPDYNFIAVKVQTEVGGEMGTHNFNNEFFEIHENEITFFDVNSSKKERASSGIYPVLEYGTLLSPNEDLLFDQLVFRGVEYVNSFQLDIEDLDENLVFSTNDRHNYWDGKFMGVGALVAPGPYIYTLVVDGYNIDGQFLVEY